MVVETVARTYSQDDSGSYIRPLPDPSGLRYRGSTHGTLGLPWDRIPPLKPMISFPFGATGEEWCPVDRKGARGQDERTHMTAPSTVAIADARTP